MRMTSEKENLFLNAAVTPMHNAHKRVVALRFCRPPQMSFLLRLHLKYFLLVYKEPFDNIAGTEGIQLWNSFEKDLQVSFEKVLSGVEILGKDTAISLKIADRDMRDIFGKIIHNLTLE